MSIVSRLPGLSVSLKTTVRDISGFVHLNEAAPDQYEEAGFGASANVFRGSYTREDGQIVKVAVKCVRPKNTDESEEISMEKVNKKVAHELSIWHLLNEGHNIVELLGIFKGIKSIPSFVCELCPCNLGEYLERKSPPPRSMKMLTDTLQGLSFMHGLLSGPVSNILVTSDETAKLCDFGRSWKQGDIKGEIYHSSALAGTPRYMSPELFEPNLDRPTPAADMWAYGCVALEVLCRIPPYHETTNNLEVIKLITSGHPPSHRPKGPRARLVNDTLWSALATCWRGPDYRPTSPEFLNHLLSIIESGDLPPSPIVSELFLNQVDGPPEPWPEEMPDFNDYLEIEEGIGIIASSVRANVWLATIVRKVQGNPTVVVKVPRLNTMAHSRHDVLKAASVLRKTVKERFGVRHKNIIDLIGIYSMFQPHPGFVLEYCELGNLVSYLKANYIARDEYKRPSTPIVNAYTLMCDIIDGMCYMHSYPIPIPQGDLTPENILIDSNGTAKIGLFSFGRALAALPPSIALTAPTGLILPFRWMSPELLEGNHQPTTESDMWSIGCIFFWILTKLAPYSNYREDLVGIESMRGQPPGTLADVYYGRAWITNGIWRNIGRCWSRDLLQRPSALAFSNLLKGLEGKKLDWLPVEVEDLAGKVKNIGSEVVPWTKYTAVWSEFNTNNQSHEPDIYLEMVMYQSTYVPKWYSRTISVVMKVAGDGPIDDKARALLASIRHEITIMSQLDNLHIVKLLGIDSSYDRGPAMIFEFYPSITLDKFWGQSVLSFRDGFKLAKSLILALSYLHSYQNGAIAHGDIQPTNIYVLPDGQAKLANFTCAFQYVQGESTVGRSLSSTSSTPLLPSLYFEPQCYNEKPQNRLRLPTVAGDIWSLGSIILSMFTSTFRYQRPDIYSTQIRQGVSPCDMHQLSLADHRVTSLVRSMLAYEGSDRPTSKRVLDSLLSIE